MHLTWFQFVFFFADFNLLLLVEYLLKFYTNSFKHFNEPKIFQFVTIFSITNSNHSSNEQDILRIIFVKFFFCVRLFMLLLTETKENREEISFQLVLAR